MTKKVKAIFRGQNGSCGFETNKEYKLEVIHDGKCYIQISSGDGKYCDYESFISFMKNWDNIRNV